MPPLCSCCKREQSACGGATTCHFDGPMPRLAQLLKRGSHQGFQMPCAHSEPPAGPPATEGRAYFSATPIVLEVPSGNVAGMRALPFQPQPGPFQLGSSNTSLLAA